MLENDMGLNYINIDVAKCVLNWSIRGLVDFDYVRHMIRVVKYELLNANHNINYIPLKLVSKYGFKHQAEY